MSNDKQKSLGRGLSALLGEDTEDYAQLDKLRVSKMVPIEFVRPGKYQPRHRVNDEEMQGLAQSVAEKGILQPIVVRRSPENPNDYEIIAGERRWRAAQIAKLHEVPVVIKDLTDAEALEIALVENLQRQDLSPLEEGEGYRRLMDEFSHTQEQMAKVLGKSRSHVANTLRLLALPESVKKLVDSGAITAGHARALLNSPRPEQLAQEIVKRGLNVRQTENLARSKPRPTEPTPPVGKDADTLALENSLANLLGLKVEIRNHGGRGSLVVHYGTLEQLDDVLRRLSYGPKVSEGVSARPSVPNAGPARAAAKPEATPMRLRAPEARRVEMPALQPKPPKAPEGSALPSNLPPKPADVPKLAVKLRPASKTSAPATAEKK